MKDTSIEIGVEVSLTIVCIALGIALWGFLIGGLVHLRMPYLWAAGLVFIINAGHYIWGIFYVDDDFSDIPNDGMMTSYYDFLRIIWRILALVTIGPSIHLRRAVGLLRSPSE